MPGKFSSKVNFGQALTLILGVPLLFFTILEVSARLVDAPSWFKSNSSPAELEMPSWMNLDQNRVAQHTRVKTDKDTLAWLSLFEAGDGFRVRLKPNLDTNIKNTFAGISSEKVKGFHIRSNSLGFRGPEPSSSNNSSANFRIVVYGDSSSFGWGVEEAERFDHVMLNQLKLLQPQTNFELVNFAIPGDSSEYGRLIFERFSAQYPADLLILGFGANDAKQVSVSHQAQVDKFRSTLGLQKLLQVLDQSYLFRSLRLTAGSLSQASSASAMSKGTTSAVKGERFKQNLKFMSSEARKIGAKQVLLLSLCTPGNYAKKARNVAQKNSTLYLNGQALLLKLIPKIKSGDIFPDLLAEMRKNYAEALKSNELYYVSSDACHPNALGHRIVGSELAKIIAADLKP